MGRILSILLLLVPHAASANQARADKVDLTSAARTASGKSEFAPLSSSILSAATVKQLKAALKRPRKFSREQRRQVLATIDAAVPNSKGRFPNSKLTDEEEDKFDWLAKLKKQPGQPGLGEVVVDIGLIRALRDKRTTDAALAILRFAFTDEGTLYRDECGRQIRQMAPYSLPALFTLAYQHKPKSKALRSYARYQLERMDRENPFNAVNAARINDDLLDELFVAFGKERHREAVPVVFAYLDDDAYRVRKRAREIALSYVTGDPPPEAPKRRLKIPGGKLTSKAQPLWFNARDLADYEIKAAFEKYLSRTPPRNKAEALKQLFKVLDDKRRKARQSEIDAAINSAKNGNHAVAVARYRKLVGANPEFKLPESARADMLTSLHTEAQKALDEGRFREASVLFSREAKLHQAEDKKNKAMALVYFAQAKAAGANGEPLLKRAQSLSPSLVEQQEERLAAAGKKPLLLYIGIGSAVVALVFVVLGFLRRKQDTPANVRPA